MYASERLVVCRNAAVAAERVRKRESMLNATEKRTRQGQRDRLRAARKLRNDTAGKIGERDGKVIEQVKDG